MRFRIRRECEKSYVGLFQYWYQVEKFFESIGDPIDDYCLSMKVFKEVTFFGDALLKGYVIERGQ